METLKVIFRKVFFCLCPTTAEDETVYALPNPTSRMESLPRGIPFGNPPQATLTPRSHVSLPTSERGMSRYPNYGTVRSDGGHQQYEPRKMPSYVSGNVSPAALNKVHIRDVVFEDPSVSGSSVYQTATETSMMGSLKVPDRYCSYI